MVVEQQIIAILLDRVFRDLHARKLDPRNPMKIVCKTMEYAECYKHMPGSERKEHVIRTLKALKDDEATLGLDGATMLTMYINGDTIDTIIDLSKQRYELNKPKKPKLASLLFSFKSI